MVLVWAVRGFRSGESPTDLMVLRTKSWFDDIERDRHMILVPAPVIGEYLAGVDPARHAEAAGRLAKQFPVSAYGLVAAVRFAELWHTAYGTDKPGAKARRHKVDMQIVACALAAGADCLCSHDDDVRRVAEGHIRVMEVPPLRPVEQTLPGMSPAARPGERG